MIVSENKDERKRYVNKATDLRKELSEKKEAFITLEKIDVSNYKEYKRKQQEVQHDIDATYECEMFFREYGKLIEIPCGKRFSLVVTPCLNVGQVRINGFFQMKTETEDYLYDHLLGDHYDLFDWFDGMAKSMIFGLNDSPNLERISIKDIEKLDQYFATEKVKAVCEKADEMLELAVKYNK